MTRFAVERLGDAVDATRAFLFPVASGRWLRLAVLSVLVAGGSGFGGGGGVSGGSTGATEAVEPAVGLSSGEAVVLVLAGAALVVGIGLVVGLLASVAEFVLVASLRSESVTLRASARRFWRRGVRLFVFRTGLFVALLAVLAVAVAAVALPAALGVPLVAVLAALVAVPAALAAVLLAVAADRFTVLFVVPTMLAADEHGVIAGWRRFWSVLRPQWRQYAAYAAVAVALALVTGFVDRVSKNGNTLMNVGPRPDGTIPEEAEALFRGFGDWYSTNKQAITGTRPWWTFGEGPTEVTSDEFEEASALKFTSEDVRFTRSGDSAYAILMDWPEDSVAEIQTSLHQRVTGRGDGRADDLVAPDAIELVGTDSEVDWELDRDAGVLRVKLPSEVPAGLDHAYALRLAV